jgi:GDP-L-fucose synthase
MKIGMNVFELCSNQRVRKLTQIGTVCSYPEITPVPFVESNLWNGRPEPTNAAYGVAKRALIELADALYKQNGLNSSTLLLANLYGPGDDFREGTSHVIPAIIKKALNAQMSGMSKIDLWGDGSPTRDFLFVDDAAKAIVEVSLSDKVCIKPLNVGTGNEISIKSLADKLLEILECDLRINWLTDKPNGQPRRSLNTDAIKEIYGFNSSVKFHQGLQDTIEYYKRNKEFLDEQRAKYE